MFTQTNCGDVAITVQNLIFTVIRDIRTRIHTELAQSIAFSQNIPMPSHDYNWKKLGKKTDRVSQSVVALLQFYDSKKTGSGVVYMFTIWNSNILHQAVNNDELTSEPEQLINACAGRCVWKCQNMWPDRKVLKDKHHCSLFQTHTFYKPNTWYQWGG